MQSATRGKLGPVGQSHKIHAQQQNQQLIRCCILKYFTYMRGNHKMGLRKKRFVRGKDFFRRKAETIVIGVLLSREQ